MKYALLIGINYTGSPSQLMGCINDVQDMQQQLIEHHGYQPEHITVLTDETNTQPTKHNILTILQTYAHQPDIHEFFLHYSGHGTSVQDKSSDELDNKDEALVPIDHNLITDDELKEILCKIPCKVFCLLDCCHSGTALDLCYQYQFMSHKWQEVSPSKHHDQQITMVSGCLDKQTSADAYINGRFRGAMTYAYLTTMQRYKHHPDLLQLLLGMRYTLKRGKYRQLPQLNCNKSPNIHSSWM